MQKRIVYTRPDGCLSVVLPVISRGDPKEFTEADAVARVLAKDIPADAADVRVVEFADLPADRTFREAWKADLTVDMPKAREIHMGRIRKARDKELARLDIEQLKGADVAAAKQKLRDLPQKFDLSSAAMPEALKALWPAGLPAD